MVTLILEVPTAISQMMMLILMLTMILFTSGIMMAGALPMGALYLHILVGLF